MSIINISIKNNISINIINIFNDIINNKINNIKIDDDDDGDD